MESKKCTQCGKDQDVSEFNKSNRTKDGLRCECKQCRIKYNTANKEMISLKNKQYYKDNRERIRDRRCLKYLNNKEKVSKYGKKYRESNAKYKTYYAKLTVEELPRLHDDGVSLEVLCKYCGKYFIPTINNVKHRLEALCSNRRGGGGFLYCSDNCKTSCPIYRQVKYPKGFKKASSREVNSLVRQMCFKRDGWLCQICGKSIDEVQLHCHHIEGYAQNPMLGNDIENVITLCKECHKEVHKLPGCNYNDLRCG